MAPGQSQGENIRERVARHDVEIEYLKGHLSVLEELREAVAEMRAEIRQLRVDVEDLRRQVARRNGTYRWLVASMIALSASFVSIAVALLRVVLGGG